MNNSSALDSGINLNAFDVIIMSLNFLILIPALVLNITVMWVLLHLKTESNFMVYLKNLVAADLLMTLTMQISVASKLPGATLELRAFTCRFSSVFFYISMYMSIILMGLISLDRFFKIVQPCGRKPGQKLLFGRIVSFFAWAVLLALDALPTIIMTSESPYQRSSVPMRLCMRMKTQLGREFHNVIVRIFVYVFWVILVQTVFCYTCIGWTVLKSYNNSGSTNMLRKLKTEAKVFIVLVVFLVCYAPYHIIRIPYTELQVKDDHSCTWLVLRVAKDVALSLSATNVLLDPLIYFILHRGFREKLLAFTKSMFCCC